MDESCTGLLGPDVTTYVQMTKENIVRIKSLQLSGYMYMHRCSTSISDSAPRLSNVHTIFASFDIEYDGRLTCSAAA